MRKRQPTLCSMRVLFLVFIGLLGLLLAPSVALAHATLLRSDPAQDAVLSAAPRGVRMWFSEDLNPVISTAAVLNAGSQRIDQRDARIPAQDSREMDLTLPPGLLPGSYLVLWRTGSFSDGHTLRGSFLFRIANADGTVPPSQSITTPRQDPLGGSDVSIGNGPLDGPMLFLLLMISLTDLFAVFWAGGYVWLTLVARGSQEHLQDTRGRMQRVFERHFAVPTLLLLLLVNVGVLAGQALGTTGGQWVGAFAPGLLMVLATSSRFGWFWLMRQGVILVGLLLAVVQLRSARRTEPINAVFLWGNLGLGFLLLVAMSLSSHAAAVSADLVPLAVTVDVLHLVGAALWVGGMLFIATIYLPVLAARPVLERGRSLLALLPRYSPFAVVGVTCMALTGPVSTTLHLRTWDQWVTTAYGRILLVKLALVLVLLGTSALHVLFLRPRLKREERKYSYVVSKREAWQEKTLAEPLVPHGQPAPLPETSPPPTDPGVPTEVGAIVVSTSKHQQRALENRVRLREQRFETLVRRLSRVLTIEPIAGVAILLCVGLMNIYAGTLTPLPAPPPASTATQAKPARMTAGTTDGVFFVHLTVDPNRFGRNTFTVIVTDVKTGQQVTNVGVSIYTTMTDMDMGTDTINLLPVGHGAFQASGDLGMAGHWRLRVVLRTLDNHLHLALLQLFTPA